jgi:hypothetical protein
MNREPIAIINAAVAAIQASIPLVLAFGIVELAKEQSGAITAAIAAWAGLVGTVIGRSLVTPVADPRDGEGKRLTTMAEAEMRALPASLRQLVDQA